MKGLRKSLEERTERQEEGYPYKESLTYLRIEEMEYRLEAWIHSLDATVSVAASFIIWNISNEIEARVIAVAFLALTFLSILLATKALRQTRRIREEIEYV